MCFSFIRDLIEGHIKYLKSVLGEAVAEKQREVRLLQESISTLWKNVAEKVNNKEEVKSHKCLTFVNNKIN